MKRELVENRRMVSSACYRSEVEGDLNDTNFSDNGWPDQRNI